MIRLPTRPRCGHRFKPELILLISLVVGAGPLAAQEVTLPLAYYEELRQQARLPETPTPEPPAPFAFESADLEIAVSDSSARVRHQLTLSIFGEGWQRIPLGQAGSFVAAELGDLEGQLDVQDEQVSLLVRGVGRHRVRLDSVVRVASDEDSIRPEWRAELVTPPAAVVRGRIAATVAAEEAETSTTGLLTKSEDGDATWNFLAAADSKLNITLRGERQTPTRVGLPLRYRAVIATVAEIGRNRVEAIVALTAHVLQGQLENLELTVPEGYEVARVDGPIAGWEVQGGVLQIASVAPLEQSWALRIQLVGKTGDRWQTPLLRPLGGRQERHLMTTRVQGDGLLELLSADAVRAATDGELSALPPALRRAGRFLAVLDPDKPPRWQLTWPSATEVLAAQIDRLWLDIALGEDGNAAYQMWIELRNRGMRDLEVTMPPGFRWVQASRQGRALVPGAVDLAVSERLVLPLEAGDDTRWVHLSGLLPMGLPDGDGTLELPVPAFSAPVGRVQTRAVLPGGRSYRLADPTRADSVPLPPSGQRQASEQLRSNYIASQMAVFTESNSRQSAFLWPVPAGFTTIEAVWSALQAAPGPLMIQIEEKREKSSWF